MTMTSIEEIKLDAIRKAGVGLSVNACPVFDNPADKAVWLTAWYAENDDTDRGQWIKGNKFFSILKAHTRKNKLAYVFMQLDNLQVIVRSSNLSKIEDLFLNEYYEFLGCYDNSVTREYIREDHAFWFK